jgi:hypothetical protein
MFKISVLAGISLVLMSCGGSSGSDSEGNSGGNGSSAQNTLSVKLLYSNECGQITPASDAAIIIHNDDLSNEKVIMANANGEVSYTSNNAKKTMSTVFRGNVNSAGIKPVFLYTYVDHPMTDIGEIEVFKKNISTCECQTSDLKVQLPSASAGITSIKMSGNRSIANIDRHIGYANLQGIEYCKNGSGEWPITSVFVETTGGEKFGAVIADISATSEVTTDLIGSAVSINTEQSYIQVLARINGATHFLNSGSNYEEVFGFNSAAIEYNVIYSYDFQDIYGVEEVDNAYLFTLSNIDTTNLNQSFYLSKPQIDYVALTDILDAPGNYSVPDQGIYDLAIFSMSATSVGEPILSWTVEAPLSGQSLNIDNVNIDQFISEAILDNVIDNVAIDLGVDGYEGINGYADFQRKKIAKNSQAPGFNTDWAQSQYGVMSFQTSNLNFSNLSYANTVRSLKNAKFRPRTGTALPLR